MGFTAEDKSTFEELYQEAGAVKDDLKIVRLVDRMLEVLVASGEAHVKHIDATRVVPHKANRSGSIMEVGKVYTKGSKIMGVGFSLARCDHKRAIAFQVKPGDDRDIKAFVDYANGSPHLADFDSASVEACSVGCGHLNQFLAAVSTECEVPLAFHEHCDLFGARSDASMPFDLKTRGGTKLDKHRLCKSQGAQFSSTLELGLKWTCIPYKFEQLYPKLPHYIQKALNSEHHIGEGETWDEQLRGIAASIVEHFKEKKASEKIDYAKIARATLASKPPRAFDVPSQLDFCKKWGGASSQKYVFDICEFCKLSCAAHIVSGATFEALCRLKMPSDSMCPEFIAAVVKCSASRGQSTRLGASIHLTEGDIKFTLKVDVYVFYIYIKNY